MKKLQSILALISLCSVGHAGLITHTDYTAGNVITSAGQNANENTIVNEINGSINSVNIAVGGVTSSNILDGTIVTGDLSTVIQSSMTNWNAYALYSRPSLSYFSSTVVIIENGKNGVANQAAILFPDGSIRVDSITLHINLDISRNAQFVSGTIQSGLRTGSVANNSWYAVYAVKSQANSTDFVAVADTLVPITSNFATLNTNFGTNSWVYLGMIAYGDNLLSPSAIVSFVQSGNQTIFTNQAVTSTATVVGVMISTASAATSVTYSYSAGVTFGLVPDTIKIAQVGVMKAYDASDRGATFTNSAGTSYYGYAFDGTLSAVMFHQFWIPITKGFKAADYNSGSGLSWNILLTGFVDNALGVGTNPLF